MIDIIITVLTVLDVIIAVLLIPLILVQQTKDGGFGSAFGGVGESVFGVHAASHLAKLTVILASAFLVVTLALTVITGHRNAPKKGILEQQPQIESAATETATETPVKPAETTEVKPDGTIVKHVEGGTITMKPVEQSPTPSKPSASDQKTESVETLPDGTIVRKVEGGTITMKPVKTPPAEKPAERVETLPDGTIVKHVEGGTITMKPVKSPEKKPEATLPAQTPEKTDIPAPSGK